ncbi:MAG: 30S ribosomal protein S6 [Desulfobacterales bacterium]|nr:30S ribosomal protein S6 [Desulfobacterales bacterium]
MRRYETIFIVNPDLSAEQHTPVFDKIKDLISQQQGMLIQIDEWGTRKLAYEIKKKIRGYYVRLDYCGTGSLVNELERFFRIDERVLKYMTIVQDLQVDTESIIKEISDIEEAKAAQEKAKQAPPEAAPAPGATSEAPPAETEPAGTENTPAGQDAPPVDPVPSETPVTETPETEPVQTGSSKNQEES